MKRHLIPAAACLWFFLSAQFFVPGLGVQNDEARFASPIFLAHSPANPTIYFYRIGPFNMPLMVASYAGTLKTLLWWPIFATFGTNAWTLREPAILAGLATIILFYALMLRVAGLRAATVGCVLLAVDPLFLLTTCFDWGPQALQHLLLIAGVLLAVASSWGAAAFLFGLALWDKAIALWMLGGLTIATAIIYPKQIPWRRLPAMAAWCALGMLPLILYNGNFHSRFATFRQNAQPNASPIAAKIQVLRATFDGSGLFGFFDRGPANAHHDWMLIAFLLALALTPLAGPAARRIILFCTIAMAVAWGQMLWTAGAGSSVHHTILLWPLPQAIMGVSFAAASRRGSRGLPIMAAMLAVLACSCTLVAGDYYQAIDQNGASSNWSRAINDLAKYVEETQPAAIYPVDWGFTNNLAFLTAGQARIAEADGEDDPQTIHSDALYIAHAPEVAVLPARRARLLELAAKLGYHFSPVTSIPDNSGRKLFELYRMTK